MDVFWCCGVNITLFGNFREHGYKLWPQRFLGWFGWTSVSYDWSMVFNATINQSKVTVVHQKDPKNRCAESLHPFGVGKCLVSFQSLVIEPVHNTNGPRIEGRVKKAQLLYINFKLNASFLSSVYFSPFFLHKDFLHITQPYS